MRVLIHGAFLAAASVFAISAAAPSANALSGDVYDAKFEARGVGCIPTAPGNVCEGRVKGSIKTADLINLILGADLATKPPKTTKLGLAITCLTDGAENRLVVVDTAVSPAVILADPTDLAAGLNNANQINVDDKKANYTLDLDLDGAAIPDSDLGPSQLTGGAELKRTEDGCLGKGKIALLGTMRFNDGLDPVAFVITSGSLSVKSDTPIATLTPPVAAPTPAE